MHALTACPLPPGGSLHLAHTEPNRARLTNMTTTTSTLTTSTSTKHVQPCQRELLTYFSPGRYFRLAELMPTHPSRHPTKPWRLSELHVRDEGCNLSISTYLL